ncbi:MAG TPA: HlyD family efflux transporter periplasmic adaptor subunit [Pirellulaceae bacterium]|nr:HlyD family efflux transporter periplasmic adaptor subunit [Pirellulaceae bacterium]HMO93950.1 HlyD family efflux transporter periplasmic adaptor subunit [Pirellulaceae bacterium]HMP67956.1 HlyD family efflux transporter periplasmic adaptor subunit [Pirellulaceae bacterium]
MRSLVCFLFVFNVASVAYSQDTAAPVTHEVTRGLFNIDIEVAGVIESRRVNEISIRTHSWSALEIDAILDQGVNVKKGDMLVRFKTDELVEAIDDLKYECELARFDLNTLELELAENSQTLEMDQQLSERSLSRAEEDFEYFVNVERPLSEKSARDSVKNSQWSVENAQDELEQLRLMYTEDELVEASEAIVLKRAERQLEQAKNWLERAEISLKRTLETDLPRSFETRQNDLDRLRLQHIKTRSARPISLERQKVAVERATFALNRKLEKLNKLKQDLDMMTVVAPVDGVLYHGKCNRGKWSASGSGNGQLKVGDAVTRGTVILSIVDTSDVFIRCDLDEQHLGSLTEGMKGKATLTGFPDRKAEVSVESVNYIPVSDGRFDCKIKIEQSANLMPGLNCKIKLRVFEDKNALSLPSSSVFTDDETEYYVYRVRQASAPQRVVVQIGKSHDGRTQISSGVAAGDRVLQEKP